MTVWEEMDNWLRQRGIMSLFSGMFDARGADSVRATLARRPPPLSDEALDRLTGLALAGRQAAQEITEFGTLAQATIDGLPVIDGARRGVYNYTVIVEIPDDIAGVPRFVTVTVQGGSTMTPEELDEAIRREAERVMRESPPSLTLEGMTFTVIGVYRG